MTQIADLSVLVRADIGQFQQGMNSVSSGMRGLSSTMQTLGSNMSSFGTQTAALWAPIVGGLGAAVVAATNFDTAMTNVNSILQLGSDEAAALNAEVLQIGGSALAGPQAVAEAMYDVVGGVADASQHIPILNAAIATSEAGAADLGATVNVLISSMNSYGASAEDAAHFSDVLTASVASGVGSMDGLAAAMPQVTGLANTMGISFDSLGGMMAYLTTKGATWSTAATQMNGAMSEMLNSTPEMSAALSSLGFESGQAAVEALGLQGAYQALVDNGADLTQLIQNQEGLRGALALTSAGATEFLTNFVANIDGATAAAREVQLGSAQAQFDLLKASVGELGVVLGGNIMVALQNIAEAVTPIVQGITEWAVANPQASGTIVALVGGIALLGAAMIPLGMLVSGLGVLFGGFATVIASAAGPFIALALVVATLAVYSGDLGAVSVALNDVGNAVTRIVSGDVQGWTDLGVALVGLVGVSFVTIADGIIGIINSVTGANFGSVTEGMSALGQGLNDAWLALQIVGTMIQTEISNFGLGVQLRVQQFIADLRQDILNLTSAFPGGAIDIAPTINMDIAQTQSQIQANLDAGAAAITTLTDPIMADATVEASTVDTSGLNTSVGQGILEVGQERHTLDLQAAVTVTASVDTSSAQATITASVNSLNITSSGSFGGRQTSNSITSAGGIGQPADVSIPHALTGANINSDGLVYAHAGERILNPAETSGYGKSAAPVIYNISQNNYGEAPYEVLRMTRKAARDAAPG